MADKKKNILKIDNKVIIVLIIAIILILTVIFINKNKESDISPYIANINGKEVTSNSVNKYLKSSFNTPYNFDLNALPKAQLETILLQFAVEKELLKIAKKSKIAKDPNIANKIAEAENKILKEAFLEKIATEATTRSALESEYETFSVKVAKQLEGKTEYAAKHILTKTKSEANVIYNKITKNQDSFENLAKENSIDTVTAKNGGDLGYFLEGNMVPEFENKIKAIELNKLSKPFKSKFGWHIIIVTDKRPAKVPALNDIYEQLKKELSYKAINNYLTKLKENIKVELLNTNKSKAEITTDNKSDLETN